MGATYENSLNHPDTHFTLHKYKNLANIAHFHDDYELIQVERGSADVTVNNNLYTLSEKECAFIHSTDIHSIRSSPDSIVNVLKLSKNRFDILFAENRLLQPVLNPKYFTTEYFKELQREIRTTDRYGSLIALNMLTITFAQMMRNEITVANTVDNNHNNEFFIRISEFTSQNFSSVTFSEAAAYMGFSEPYFSKIFKQLFGMTFTRYLNTLRIGNAIKMIKKEDKSITDCAFDCGFKTIRSFNRTFKELTGYTPSALPHDYVFFYRIRKAEGIDPTLRCTELIE